MGIVGDTMKSAFGAAQGTVRTSHKRRAEGSHRLRVRWGRPLSGRVRSGRVVRSGGRAGQGGWGRVGSASGRVRSGGVGSGRCERLPGGAGTLGPPGLGLTVLFSFFCSQGGGGMLPCRPSSPTPACRGRSLSCAFPAGRVLWGRPAPRRGRSQRSCPLCLSLLRLSSAPPEDGRSSRRHRGAFLLRRKAQREEGRWSLSRRCLYQLCRPPRLRRKAQQGGRAAQGAAPLGPPRTTATRAPGRR